MGAEYSFHVKSIANYAPTFFGYIISVLANVIRLPNQMGPTQSSSMELFGLLNKSHLYPTYSSATKTYLHLPRDSLMTDGNLLDHTKRNMRGLLVQG